MQMAGSYAGKKVLTELSVAEAVHFPGKIWPVELIVGYRFQGWQIVREFRKSDP